MRPLAPAIVFALLLAGVLSAQQGKVEQDKVAPPAPAGERLNLARTSLATISASSVNGNRPLDNEFYGIQKAFDDGGKKLPNGITYNYWMAEAGEFRPWVIVHFSTPVDIQEIVAMGAPPFRAELQWAGDFEFAGKADGSLKLDKPAPAVTAVRITFEPRDEAATPVRVDEIRVLGTVPPAVKFAVQDPAVALPRVSPEAAATAAFAAWKRDLLANAKPTTTETPDAFITTYRNGTVDLVRITVQKSDGKTTTEPLAKLAPASNE